MIRSNRKKLGDLLIEAGLINKEQLNTVLDIQRTSGKKIGELLITEGYISEKQMIQVLREQLGIPYVDLEQFEMDPETPKLIGEALARKYTLIPIKKENKLLTVAMIDPLNIFAVDDVKIATGCDVEPVLGTRQDILNTIDQYFGKQHAEQAMEEFKKEYNIENVEDLDEETLKGINNAPVVRLVNSVIQQAMKAKASDIHIEPFETFVRVRFRVDGELIEIMTTTKSAHSAIATRIKIMGRMDIAEKRIPQDGRVEMELEGREVDLRISVLPTVFGEKVVIRLLDRNNFMMSKKKLGFTEHNEKIFEKIIKAPNGIILVTGPTGSGKSTTLYTVLSELNKINKNIITVEDPVEYRLEGINQVQVNNKAGLTFASGLRSILRQDPDIIMIGEIRDEETAHIAVKAAITGHLVLSTLHTNDTPSTVTRLVDMGVEPYMVSSSVVGILAQRLVKKICPNCKVMYEPDDTEKEAMRINESFMAFKGQGCPACNHTGYKGRIAIHEILTITKQMRNVIDRGGTIDEIRKTAVQEGTKTLNQNARELVLEGVTTIEELIRVAYSID